MAKTIRQKYNKKKKVTLEERDTGFELSFEEYRSLIERATSCDYTGIVFSPEHHLSIERIDASKPYKADNCCCVTVHVNSLKDSIEKGHEGSLTIKDLELVNKIKHTLATKTVEELTRKYRLTGQKEEVPMLDKLELNPKEPTDISIAKSYVSFSGGHTGSLVTFSKYKKLYTKKSCEWSGKVFGNSNSYASKVFIKKDENKTFSDDNIIVVCSILHKIKNNGVFTEKELLKFIKRELK